jgi:hypothetical protein
MGSKAIPIPHWGKKGQCLVVEMTGFEPATSGLQSRRSSS